MEASVTTNLCVLSECLDAPESSAVFFATTNIATGVLLAMSLATQTCVTNELISVVVPGGRST